MAKKKLTKADQKLRIELATKFTSAIIAKTPTAIVSADDACCGAAARGGLAYANALMKELGYNV